MIPPDLRSEYAYEQSVGSAGDGGSPLWFVPLVGIAVGALRGRLRYDQPPAATPGCRTRRSDR